LISRELQAVPLQAKNKNASGGGGGMRKIRGLKNENAPKPCSLGRSVAFYKRKYIPISTFLSREIFNFSTFFVFS
jgi:hypothetical protein